MTDVRILLTDKAIARLPTAKDGWYLARDTELKGFFVVVGKRKRTFTVQGDLRQGGKRASSIRVAIGDASEISTRTARATAKDYLAQISRGQHPKAEKRGAGAGKTAAPEGEAATLSGGITLRQAWERYRDAHLVRKGRSELTIESYRDHVERIFIEWLDAPLQELGLEPAKVVTKHDDITKENGPYIANGSMRTLRAIYNHARKANKSLPADNPVNAIDWNGEKRRDTGMGTSDLKGWFAELAALDNPIRREFHLFTLLSGCRPTALQGIHPSHVNFGRRMVHIPKPKGGAKRAFDIPLSREMVLCVVRAARAGPWRPGFPVRGAGYAFRSKDVPVAGGRMDIPRRQRIGAPRRAKGGSSHAVEVGQRSSAELPNYCDCSRRVGVRCKTADEPRYSWRECWLHYSAQTSRRSSPQPATSDQQRRICGAGRNACRETHGSRLACSRSNPPRSSENEVKPSQ
jgi:integrase